MQNNDFTMSNLPTEEGYKLRPRDIPKILEILDSRDNDGNRRYLDQRDVITRALELFFTWELEPEKFLDEIKSSMTSKQEQQLSKKLQDESVEKIDDKIEQVEQQEARKSEKDYEKMLTNLESAKNVIKQINMKDLQSNVDDQEITYDSWPLLWNFYSRLLPAKISITVLGDMISSSKTNRVDVHEFRKNVYDICEELSEKIINYERKNKLRRTTKFSTGFPVTVNPDALKQGLAEKRFKDKYAVSIRKKHGGAYHLEGILAALGLITVMRSNDKKHYVSMTDAGKKFYLLDNPILKDDYFKENSGSKSFIDPLPTNVFSDDETDYIFEKLIPQRELEDRLVARALYTAGHMSMLEFEQRESLNWTATLDDVFLKEFNDFVESYDHEEHKQRLLEKFINASANTSMKFYKYKCGECVYLAVDMISMQLHQKEKGHEKNMKKYEAPIQACRSATMGRLSELKLVDWSIGEDSHSKYSLTKGEKYWELIEETLGRKEEMEKWKKSLDDYLAGKKPLDDYLVGKKDDLSSA